MANPRDEQILFRTGGRTLQRYGVPWRRQVIDGFETMKPTMARADATTCATYRDVSGLIRIASANVLRFDAVDLDGDGYYETQRMLLEPPRTNLCLQNRDMTQAVWTKTTCTAAKDQVGIDGAANSASKLTATAGNATCLQAITSGSALRYQTAYLKRISGSGNIQMTQDNGSTWTTVAITTAWTRLTIPAQTLTNPTVGFRIVTNGDVIAVDGMQNELGSYPTSVLFTAASTVARTRDDLSFPLGFPVPAIGEEYTLYEKFDPEWPYTGSDGTAPGLFSLGGFGSFAVDGLSCWDTHRSTAAASLNFRLDANSASGVSTTVNLPASGTIELISRIQASGLQHVLYAEIAGVGNSTSGATDLSAYPWRSTVVLPGDRGNSHDAGAIFLHELIVARGRFTLAEMQAA